MRIVYLNPVGILGGAERSLLTALESVRQADPSAELHLVVFADGPLREEATRLGVSTTLLPLPARLTELGDSGLRRRGLTRMAFDLARQAPSVSWAAYGFARRLRRLVRTLEPDVIHSNGNKAHLLAHLAGLGRYPLFWHIHDFLGLRPIARPMLRWASSQARAALAVSQAVARDTVRVLPRLPVQVVANAVDTRRFAPAAEDGRLLDRLAGLPPLGPDGVRIGLVATFARWKGQDVFLEAASRLVRELPQVPVRFYVVGGPIYRTLGSQFTLDELRARAKALGLARHVGFVGFQAETPAIYRALDVVVHASTQPEPFGLTILEAMACARPVIVSRAGGAAELFTDGDEALGIAPGDIVGLAATLRRLVVDGGLRRRLGSCARAAVVARHGHQRIGPQLLSIYAANSARRFAKR